MNHNLATPTTTDLLRTLIRRLSSRHRVQSIKTLSLSLLAAGTEGLGILLLIPLLALVGISSNLSAEWVRLLGLAQLGIAANIYVVLAIFLCLLGFRQFIVYRQRVVSMATRLEFSHQLRDELFAALVHAEWKHFSAGTVHRQVQILTLESSRAGNSAQHAFTLTTTISVTLVQIAIAAFLSTAFTVVALAGAVVLAFLLRKNVPQSAKLGRKLTEHHETYYALTSNLLPMLRTARMAAAADRLVSRFRASSNAINETILLHTTNHTASVVAFQLIAAVALSVCVVVGVQFLALDALILSMLILIFARLTPMLAQAQQLTQQLAHDLPVVQMVLDNIAQWKHWAEVSVGQPATPIQRPRRAIELRGVVAGYAGSAEEHFLQNISFRIPVGTVTLILGATGAGKSTLADVVAGLIRPDSGEIVLDEQALDAGQLASWRTHVGYVEQGAALFTGTLRENLSWGCDEIDRHWLDRVLWASTVEDFLDGLPRGLDSSVGEGGAKLSGGQKQRVAIARELLRKPALLVLDEATSGLDEVAESKVLRRISDLALELSVLLISHRSSTRRYADQTVELEDGRIKTVTDLKRADTRAISGAKS